MDKISVILEKAEADSETKVELMKLFTGYYDQIGIWKKEAESLVVKDVNDTKTMEKAKAGRLKVKSVRIQIEKKRKELKESSLKRGRLIDSIAKLLKEDIEGIEKYLYEQENYKKIKEQEAKEKRTKEREETLSKLDGVSDIDMSMYNYADMTNEQFSDLCKMIIMQVKEKREEEKREKERIKKEKEDRQKEAERIAKEKAELEYEQKKLAEQQKKLEEDKKREAAKLAKEKEEMEEKLNEAKRVIEEKDKKQQSLFYNQETIKDVTKQVINVESEDKDKIIIMIAQMKQLIYPVFNNEILEERTNKIRESIHEYIKLMEDTDGV